MVSQVVVYRTEHEYPEESVTQLVTPQLPVQHDADSSPPPVPLARSRTRSRSQNSWAGYDDRDHHSVSDVDSLTFDSGSGRYVIDMKETNGYTLSLSNMECKYYIYIFV